MSPHNSFFGRLQYAVSILSTPYRGTRFIQLLRCRRDVYFAHLNLLLGPFVRHSGNLLKSKVSSWIKRTGQGRGQVKWTKGEQWRDHNNERLHEHISERLAIANYPNIFNWCLNYLLTQLPTTWQNAAKTRNKIAIRQPHGMSSQE